jgi:hypothetical protein
MEDGETMECSRRVAAILYLTPGGWRVVGWEGAALNSYMAAVGALQPTPPLCPLNHPSSS